MNTNMNKYKKYYLITWAILFVLYNVIVFLVIPNEIEVNGVTVSKFSGSFWPGYIGIVVAFIGNLICSILFFNKSYSKEKAFLNMPVFTISWGALITTMIVGTLTMLIWELKNWIGVLICLLVLAYYALAVVKSLAAAEAVSDVSTKVQQKISAMKSMTADAQILLNKSNDREIAEQCEKVYEAFRYADPMSGDGLYEIEYEIKMMLRDFSDAVSKGNTEKVKNLAIELIKKLQDRAIKCKALK